MLKQATEKLNDYGLQWWTPSLLEILDQFISTYKGNPDQKFWKYIFKYYYGGGSGVNPSIDGWIINFFPYIDDRESKWAKRNIQQTMKEYDEGDKNDMLSNSEDFLEADLTQPGLDIEKIKKCASGINITPFLWSYHGDDIQMNFISGFAGATMS